MSKPENPPAFPTLEPHPPFGGMTLRDWFAGQALAGLLANPQHSIVDDWSWRSGSLTGDAYDYADAMLAARDTSND